MTDTERAPSVAEGAPDSAPKSALTPPTSEEWNNKREESSELSDVDEDVDDGVAIEPDHYWENGKIPVFKPTLEQFRDFNYYIKKIDAYGMKSGIVKVIPPKEWRDSLPALDEAVKTIKVKNPITQEFSGMHGIYTQANIEKQRSYNLPEWKALTEESQHQPPARRGERRKNERPSKPAAPKAKESKPTKTEDAAPARRRGRPAKKGSKKRGSTVAAESHQDDEAEPKEEEEATEETSALNAPPTPDSPNTTPADLPQPKPKPKPKPKNSSRQSKGGQVKSVSERRKYNQQELVDDIDEEAFKDFDYRFYGNGEFTPERCTELETAYWKGLTFAPPMYGADMPGSLFDSTTTSWNVAHLPSLLDVLGQKVPGVNTAYLYLGLWKATFAWHLEDVDLYSINYIHFGAPKQWYSISQEDARKFELAMKSIWPNDAKHCSEFLRHKTYLVSPHLLESRFGIKVNKLVHYEGEFVITYPYGYHSGYNLGYNCAESVNFATEKWLDYAKLAKKCQCEPDSVWVDPWYIERKFKGLPSPEPEEEYYYTEEEEDEEGGNMPGDLPSPPASVTSKKAASKKRKLDSASAGSERRIKKIKITVKKSLHEPCVLCPNDIPGEPLLPTDTGRYAHKKCALFTPETYIWPEDESEPQKICNIGGIEKSRLDLKCNYCRNKKGSCFQCSFGKCTKAYHATCADAAGVRVDSGLTSIFTPEGEFSFEADDFRCPMHRPKRPKNTTMEMLEADADVRNLAKSLKPRDTVQMQYLQGSIFAGMVVENRPGERTIVVDILPRGDRYEVEWKYVLYNDPADCSLPKPTANAKPLPKDLDRIALQNQSNQMFPSEGEVFADSSLPHKWGEFQLERVPKNAVQTKVDMAKKHQLWHYIGESSTEAKAQYTDDPGKRTHNPLSNFLDTVKPPPAAPAPRSYIPTPYTAFNQQMYARSIQAAPGQHAPRQPLPAIMPAHMQSSPYDYKPSPLGYGGAPGSHLQHGRPVNGFAPMNRPQPAPALQPRGPASSAPPAQPVKWKDVMLNPQSPYKVAPAPPPVAPAVDAPPSEADTKHLEKIKKYPYLANSFLRRPRQYKSPYLSDGNFDESYAQYISPAPLPLQPAYQPPHQPAYQPAYPPAHQPMQMPRPVYGTSFPSAQSHPTYDQSFFRPTFSLDQPTSNGSVRTGHVAGGKEGNYRRDSSESPLSSRAPVLPARAPGPTTYDAFASQVANAASLGGGGGGGGPAPAAPGVPQGYTSATQPVPVSGAVYAPRGPPPLGPRPPGPSQQ